MTRHDRHELRSAILTAVQGDCLTTEQVTAKLDLRVSSATVRKHLVAMESDGYVTGGYSASLRMWSLPYRGADHVGTVYQSPEGKLFNAAANLVQTILDRTSIDQRTLAVAMEVRDGLRRLVWMEEQGLDHGLKLEAAPTGAERFLETVPRYVIAEKGEEALFKIGKP